MLVPTKGIMLNVALLNCNTQLNDKKCEAECFRAYGDKSALAK